MPVEIEQQIASYFEWLDKSSESRLQIWGQLAKRYERSPLGIGPGNSSFMQLSIATRERRDSYASKEAHNDYVGYGVERGPFALLALIALIVMAFRRVWMSWAAAVYVTTVPRARSVAIVLVKVPE